MKSFFVSALIALTMCATASAQVIRNGNVFKTAGSSRTTGVKDTVVTKYQYEDSKGKLYPIILRKDKGWCYIWRTSAKSGRKYPYTLAGKDEEISRTIAKEYGVKYVEHTKKK